MGFIITSIVSAQGNQNEDSEEIQRERARQARDANLLPICSAGKPVGQKQVDYVPPPTLDPWDNPGCRRMPTDIVRGPKGGPVPAVLADHVVTDKRWLGQVSVNPTYDKAIYAVLTVGLADIDWQTQNDFQAGLILAVGDNSHRLEVGWFMGAFNNDEDLHLYTQDSHSCSGSPPVCAWVEHATLEFQDIVNVQLARESDSSDDWGAWEWDGSNWNSLDTDVDLGGPEAYSDV